MNMNFRDYFQITLNENDAYLGHKVGDIANGVTDLTQNYQGMGTRQINQNAEQVVNMIRRILHTHWPEEQEHTLKRLQKVGVNIMKAIEEKGDLQSILQGATTELSQAMEKLGVPANKIGTPDATQSPEGAEDGVGEPQGKAEPEQEAPQGPPDAQGQPPAAAGPSPAEGQQGAAAAPPAAPGVAPPPPAG